LQICSAAFTREQHADRTAAGNLRNRFFTISLEAQMGRVGVSTVRHSPDKYPPPVIYPLKNHHRGHVLHGLGLGLGLELELGTGSDGRGRGHSARQKGEPARRIR